MERARRLGEFWRLLPAFRAVAEHESVTKGAKSLHVTAPAVSRSIHLLQDLVGVELFRPEGRGVRLTHAGRELLEGVRLGMRAVDDAWVRAQGAGYRGAFRIACPPAIAARVIPAVLALQERYPDLVPDVGEPPAGAVEPLLLRGELDLVLTASPQPHDELEVVPFVDERYAVYCGRSHPAFDDASLSLDAIDAPRWVAASEREATGAGAVWTHGARDIAVFASDLAVRLGLCMNRGLLAVLPVRAVRDHVSAGRLREVDGPSLPARTLYAVRRRRIGPDDLADEAIEAIAVAMR